MKIHTSLVVFFALVADSAGFSSYLNGVGRASAVQPLQSSLWDEYMAKKGGSAPAAPANNSGPVFPAPAPAAAQAAPAQNGPVFPTQAGPVFPAPAPAAVNPVPAAPVPAPAPVSTNFPPGPIPVDIPLPPGARPFEVIWAEFQEMKARGEFNK